MRAAAAAATIPAGAGSGVAPTHDGFPLTSAHVVSGQGRRSDATRTAAKERFEVVGRDPLSDLAVLRT